MLQDHPGLTLGNTGARGLTDKLSGFYFIGLPGLDLIGIKGFRPMIQII